MAVLFALVGSQSETCRRQSHQTIITLNVHQMPIFVDNNGSIIANVTFSCNRKTAETIGIY
jgi:hypothetical protein